VQVADAIVEALADLGVRFVFGVSGANIELLHDAIHRRGEGRIVSVLAKSETGSAFMADGYARVHRALGVCCATSGGGMLNLLAGIAESHAASVPVLAIVGQPPIEVEGRGAFQDSSGIGRNVDALEMFRAVSKYAVRIDAAEDFWRCLTVAIRSALGGRPGPSVVLIPRTTFLAEVGPMPPSFAAQMRALVKPDPVAPEDVSDVVEALRVARAPVMLMGAGVRRAGARELAIELARATGLPVATTMSARGDFPNDDPLFLGVCGVAGHPSAHECMRRADLILAVGASMNAMTRAPFANGNGELAATGVVAINPEPASVLRALSARAAEHASDEAPPPSTTLRIEHLVRADAAEFLRAALHAVAQRPIRVPRWYGVDGRDYRLTVHRPMCAPRHPPDDPDEPGDLTLTQSEALEVIQKHLPSRGHLVYDAGNCAAAALHYLMVPPSCTATIALGMGGMGYAIAAALGTQLAARPDERTMVFTGDGSFLMTGMEVHTAVDLRLPILFVVFNNAMHGMCVTRQQVLFGGRLEAVRYARPSFAQMAAGFGPPDRVWTGAARTASELDDLLSDYARRDAPRPGVLELCLGREEVPPFLPLMRGANLEMDAWRTLAR
jgi:acetolactate synthase I/II/III large subunit